MVTTKPIPAFSKFHLAQRGDGRGDVAPQDVDGDLSPTVRPISAASSAAKATSGGPS
jgi:hypothetical protein